MVDGGRDTPQDATGTDAIRTVLVVDDDPAILGLLSDALSSAGYRVRQASSRAEMKDAIRNDRIDLVTLDLTLGAEDGLEIATELRRTVNLPIVMITGRGEPIDRVEGLERGADDYITKPFHVREALIRIRSVLDRYGTPPGQRVAQADAAWRGFDHCRIDDRRRIVVRRDGEVVDLTETEFDILSLFLGNPGRILSRDEIWQTLRGMERNPLDRTLDAHVARLRAKIGEGGHEPLAIRSVRGVGYVFFGEVAAEPEEASASAS